MKGTALTKVSLNTSQRLGLLTLGGIMTGLTTTDLTNEVLRGSFIINKLMCRGLTVPTGLNPVAPDPYSGKTARIRYGFHSAMAVCAGCHKMIDPLGLPFENSTPWGFIAPPSIGWIRAPACPTTRPSMRAGR